LNGWALGIDFIHKFLIGLLIKQFVALFRKYEKISAKTDRITNGNLMECIRWVNN